MPDSSDIPKVHQDGSPRLIDDPAFDEWLKANPDVSDWVRDGGILHRPPVFPMTGSQSIDSTDEP